MSDFGDAFGTATEGGLLARSVGHKTGKGAELSNGHFAEGECLNCATALVGSHCHACGQKAHLHRTLGAFMHDLLHGALHFEGKTWKTLPVLAFRPGELTRRYIEGERARFVSPMALFLFVIFLMFAGFQLAGISTPTEFSTMESEARSQAETARRALIEDASAPGLDARQRAAIEQDIAEFDQIITAIEEGGNYDFTNAEGERRRSQVTLTGIDIIDKGIVGKWRKNPGLMLYKLQSNFYKFSWLLIPLSIPFMALLFLWRRQFKAYDHAIFVTYSIAFMSLLVLIITLLAKAGVPQGLYASVLTVVPPLHIYKQLRGTYALTRFSALWRLAALLIFINIILLLFLQLLLVLGAF